MVEGEIPASAGLPDVEDADGVVTADGDVLPRARDCDGLVDDFQLTGK